MAAYIVEGEVSSTYWISLGKVLADHVEEDGEEPGPLRFVPLLHPHIRLQLPHSDEAELALDREEGGAQTVYLAADPYSQAIIIWALCDRVVFHI